MGGKLQFGVSHLEQQEKKLDWVLDLEEEVTGALERFTYSGF